jgi:DNA-binding PadR family transcriptional regulator/ribosomal protein S8
MAMNNANKQLDILDVLEKNGFTGTRRGHKLTGSHPVHGSESGCNFSVDLNKNVWHCFRHSTGGGPPLLIAMFNEIVNCEDCRSGSLRGKDFTKVRDIAVEKYGYVDDYVQDRKELEASSVKIDAKTDKPGELVNAHHMNGKRPSVYVVKNQEYVTALEKHGYVAITTSNEGVWKPEWFKNVNPAQEYILHLGNSSGGRRLHAKIANMLLRQGYKNIRELVISDKYTKEVELPEVLQNTENVREFILFNTEPLDITRYSGFLESFWSKPRAITEIKKLSIPPREYLIDRILPIGGFAILAAYSGIGKSLNTYYMANQLSLGKPFFGKFECKKSRILIIDAEQNLVQIQQRINMLIEPEAESNIYFLNDPAMKLSSDDAVDKVTKMVEENNIDLVIVDTFRACAGKIDENNATEIKDFFQAFMPLKQMGVTMLFLDHIRKSNMNEGKQPTLEKLFGSQDKAARMDVVLMLHKERNKDEIEFYQEKNRDGEKIQPFAFKMTPSLGGNTTHQMEYVGEIDNHGELSVADQSRQAILELLSDRKTYTNSELVEYCEEAGAGGKSTTLAEARQLNDQGFIEKDPGRPRNKNHYRITKKGLTLLGVVSSDDNNPNEPSRLLSVDDTPPIMDMYTAEVEGLL